MREVPGSIPGAALCNGQSNHDLDPAAGRLGLLAGWLAGGDVDQDDGWTEDGRLKDEVVI